MRRLAILTAAALLLLIGAGVRRGAAAEEKKKLSPAAQRKKLLDENKKLETELAKIDKQLASNRKKQEALLAAIEAGMDTKLVATRAAKLKTESEALKKERAPLAKRLADVQKQRAVPEFMTTEERLAALEKKLAESGASESNTLFPMFSTQGGRVTITGYVDTSYVASEDSVNDSFGLDQVELNIEAEWKGGLKLRVDLDFTDIDGDGDADVEQGYIEYSPWGERGPTLIVGKFNAPIGFELLDAPDMYQYSHSLLFDLGLPTNLIGAQATYQVSEHVDVAAYIANGWDNNTENNNRKTFGGRLGITPFEDLNFGISVIAGPEKDDDNTDWRRVVDIDLTYTGLPKTTIGAEFNWGLEQDSWVHDGKIDNAQWQGVSLMVNREIFDWMGVTVRGSYFDDSEGGSRSGFTTADGDGPVLFEGTIAFGFTVAERLGIVAEYRYDHANEDGVYGDDKDNHTFALELTLKF